MSSTLVNIRLDEPRRRKAKALQARGITLSDVVREAIDARFAALDRAASTPDVTALIGRLLIRHPDPDSLSPRGYDVHDAEAARTAIRRRMARRRK